MHRGSSTTSLRPRSPARRPAPGPKQAIILAAGRGSRLGIGRPKCLAEIGGRPLVAHQLDALARVGVRSVRMVVGFQRERVRAVVGDRAQYVVNERYAETNSLYSFLCAAEQTPGDAFVLNADVLFDERVLWRLLGSGPDAIAYDSTSGDEAEHMKVCHRGGGLVEMRKDLARHRCRGENLGVLRLSGPAVARALAVGRRLVDGRSSLTDWLASAINGIAAEHRIACVDVGGLPWTEIDFPADLTAARERVWPAIHGALPARIAEAAAAA